MTDQGQIRSAAASVRSARQAIHTATARRAAAVVAAQDLADAAHAAERAEQDAARATVATGLHRLIAARLTPPQIAALCQIPREDLPGLLAGPGPGVASGTTTSADSRHMPEPKDSSPRADRSPSGK